ncbi:hypothetical protein [uncultured Methylobacterium sp.]|uniref:hypothetical protein n=1 Tax=uncultured Methylobacterium sp. TaxID=157278 RepID=UPI0035CB6D6F
MEMVLILAAVAALAVSGVTVAAMAARSRRPSLRLPHEDAIHEASEDGVLEEFEKPLPSPIDRSNAVLDLEPIEAERIPDPATPRRLGSGAER